MHVRRPIPIVCLVLIIPAIILHEVSHGYVAYLLGDPTAKDAGRLTLNPLAHVDLWGTIILPVAPVASRSVSRSATPSRCRSTETHDARRPIRTACCSPAPPDQSLNIPLAIVAGDRCSGSLAGIAVRPIVVYIASFFTLINLVLAFFNLIPIPPLDGSRVVQYFLKGQALRTYNSMERYGFVIVLALVFILPRVTGIDVLGDLPGVHGVSGDGASSPARS